MRPARKSARAAARASLGIAPCTMPAGTPSAFSARDRLRAWFTVTQNAMVRRSRASSWIERATSALRSSMSTASASSLLVEVEAVQAETAGVRSRRRRDAEAAQRREEAVLDQLGQRARVDDALEDRVEALAVAARRRGGEAEQRACASRLERAELAQHAQVVVGGRVVALVVDDESHVPSAQHACQALLVQRADRADQHPGVGGRALAALDGHHGTPARRPARAPACRGPASAAPRGGRAPAPAAARAAPGARRSRSCRRPSASRPASGACRRGAPRARPRPRRADRGEGRWQRWRAT